MVRVLMVAMNRADEAYHEHMDLIDAHQRSCSECDDSNTVCFIEADLDRMKREIEEEVNNAACLLRDHLSR